MPQISLDIPHSLSQEEAAQRLRSKIAAAIAQYQDRMSDLRQEWRDYTFSFAFKAVGMAFSGTIAVQPQNVGLSLTLPLAAMLFKGIIEDRIRQEVDGLLAKDSS
jgi:hypothetical protein